MVGYAVDLPPHPRSIDEIESAIVAQGGSAFVGLKAEQARPSSETRYRAALTATEAAGALAAVSGAGVEVLNFYDAVNVALVEFR